MSKRELLICAPVRTAIGTYNGTLKDTPAVELGATVTKACLERAGLSGQSVGTVVMGNVIQAGNKMNPARQAAIGGGIPVEVPAMTVNRVCGSGAQAIATAAAEIQLVTGSSVGVTTTPVWPSSAIPRARISTRCRPIGRSY
jgi:acetyl-CoA C-acetyltransferase